MLKLLLGHLLDQGKTNPGFQWVADPRYSHLESDLKVVVIERSLRVAPHTLDLLQAEVD